MSRTTTIYGSPTCAYCKTLMAHLDTLGVKYRYIDVSVENVPGITTLPTTDVVVDGELNRITGYSPRKAKEIAE